MTAETSSEDLAKFIQATSFHDLLELLAAVVRQIQDKIPDSVLDALGSRDSELMLKSGLDYKSLSILLSLLDGGTIKAPTTNPGELTQDLNSLFAEGKELSYEDRIRMNNLGNTLDRIRVKFEIFGRISEQPGLADVLSLMPVTSPKF